MINSISIQGFKILENIENMPLSKVTLIGGKNDVGKTTVLEALFLYLDFDTLEIWNKLFSWRGFNGIWDTKEVWSKFFYNSDLTNEIRISAGGDRIKNGQLNIRFLNDYETPIPIQMSENGITTVKRNFPALEIIHSLGDTIGYQAHILYQGTISNYLKEIGSLQDRPSVFFMSYGMRLNERNADYLGILDKTDEQEKILPLLRLFEPNLTRLQLISEGGNNIIYADFGNTEKVPVNMLGDGFCRCLTMALILATKNTNVFLIDEVGAGIHYSVQEDLLKFLVKASELYDCQIIATTHSYDTIKAFNNVIIHTNNSSDFSYIRLGKNKESIKPYVFSSETLNCSISSEWEIR